MATKKVRRKSSQDGAKQEEEKSKVLKTGGRKKWYCLYPNVILNKAPKGNKEGYYFIHKDCHEEAHDMNNMACWCNPVLVTKESFENHFTDVDFEEVRKVVWQ